MLFAVGVILFRYGATPYPIANVHGHTFTLSDSAGYTLDLILPTSALPGTAGVAVVQRGR